MLRLTVCLLLAAALPAPAETLRFDLTEFIEFEGTRIAVPMLGRLDARDERTLDVRVDGILTAAQREMLPLMSNAIDPACTQRIAWKLDDIRAEGDRIRVAGRVTVTLYGCNGSEDLSYRVRLLSNTSTVDVLAYGAIEAGCIAAEIQELAIQPSGIIGGLLSLTGLTTTIGERIRTDINAFLEGGGNCLALPEALQALNTRITRGGFREIGDGGLGFFIEGSVDVTAPNLLALLRHLDEEGLLDR